MGGYLRQLPLMQAQVNVDTSVKIGHESALFDRVGVCASTLCAVHCILMPWFIMLMPVLAGTVLASSRFENIFVGISISLAAFCCYRGCMRHGKWLVMFPLVFGSVVLFGVRLSAPEICCLEDISWTHAFASAFGGVLLASSHFLNLKYSRQYTPEQKAPCCHSTSCDAHEEDE